MTSATPRKWAANDLNRPAARLGTQPPLAMANHFATGVIAAITVLGFAVVVTRLCRLRGRDIER